MQISIYCYERVTIFNRVIFHIFDRGNMNYDGIRVFTSFKKKKKKENRWNYGICKYRAIFLFFRISALILSSHQNKCVLIFEWMKRINFARFYLFIKLHKIYDIYLNIKIIYTPVKSIFFYFNLHPKDLSDVRRLKFLKNERAI